MVCPMLDDEEVSFRDKKLCVLEEMHCIVVEDRVVS